MQCELVVKNNIYKFLRLNEEIGVTNGSFISTSIRTDIVLHSMTINNKNKQEEINQIEGNIIILKLVS